MENTIPKRILFIDDELSIREVVQTCLEILGGWEVLVAASGQEGLIKAETEKPDAILLDVMMPGMDGLSFLENLRTNAQIQSIPVILLTARFSLTEPQQYSQLGIKGAIAKPFNPLTLVTEIAQTLDWNVEVKE